MKYILLFIILIFKESLSAQCTDTINQPRIIEEFPTCVNCCSIIENFINDNIDKIDLTGLDKIEVCFEIDSNGQIQNTFAIGVTNPKLISVIDKGLKSVSTWSPALMSNVPIKIQWTFSLLVKDNPKSIKLLCNFREITDLTHNTIQQNRNYQNLFKTNSNDTISYLYLGRLNGYIIDSISDKNKYLSTFSNKLKTTRLKIEGIQSEQEGVIIIPELKYKKDIHCDNCKVLDFEQIPIGKEVVLIITRKSLDKTYIFIDKFDFQGTKGLSSEGKEYTFGELNQQIKVLNQQIKNIWPRR